MRICLSVDVNSFFFSYGILQITTQPFFTSKKKVLEIMHLNCNLINRVINRVIIYDQRHLANSTWLIFALSIRFAERKFSVFTK